MLSTAGQLWLLYLRITTKWVIFVRVLRGISFGVCLLVQKDSVKWSDFQSPSSSTSCVFPAQTQEETEEKQQNRQGWCRPGLGLETTDFGFFTCYTSNQVAKIHKSSHFPIPFLKRYKVVYVLDNLYVLRAV